MDPEQVYTEVLQAEQQKGSAAPVAEARAKAARQRARHGSPHPTEPKWWPGSQPHLEGGGEAPAAEAEPVEEEPVAEAPEPEAQPDAAAAQAPAETGGAAPLPDQAPAAVPVAPAAAAPAQPAAVAAATQEAPPEVRPAGVTHGTPTGNRLRPEDGVATEAQFEGQRAMYERRKLIDELVATGVPTVAAEDHGRRGSPALALLYILIPLLAIFVLVNREESGAEGEAPAGAEAEAPAEGEGGEGGGLTVVAANIAFESDTLALKAGAANEVTLDNQDSAEHNISIYASPEDGTSLTDPLFEGDIIPGGESITYAIEGLEAGEAYFQCDVHPNMNGTVTIE